MTTYGVLNEFAGTGAASQAGTTPVAQIPLVCGAELYAEPSVTGLNTQPVDDHCALALLGSRLEALQQFPIPPDGGLGLARSAGEASRVAHPIVDLEALCTKLLSEGSVVLVREDLVGNPVDTWVGAGPAPARVGITTGAAAGAAPTQSRYILLDGLVTLDPALQFTANQFAQRFWARHDAESKQITRVFRRGGVLPHPGAEQDSAPTQNGWHVRDYIDYGTERQKQIADSTAPLDAILAYPNGLGILYRSQRAYRRLEAIFATIERLQSGSSSPALT